MPVQMSSDNQYTALGPAIVGFQTDGSNINIGAQIAGNTVGIKGTCQGPVGDGVQGTGAGNFSGVAGWGGPNSGTGVIGFGGGGAGPGVRGIGSGAQNTGPAGPAGVYGHGGSDAPGVVGQAGDGVGPASSDAEDAFPGPPTSTSVIEGGSLIAGSDGKLPGDFDAEVVKVDGPRTGDPTRSWGSQRPQELSLKRPIVARNKRVVICDLTYGRRWLCQLVAKSDILVENL